MVKDGNPDAQGLIDYNEFIQRMLAVRNQSVNRPPLVRARSCELYTATNDGSSLTVIVTWVCLGC